MTIAARPTIYNGVEMRSRLEARVAALLDERKVPWTYEPHAFGSREGQYLPDFRVVLASGPAFLEVKGRWPDDIEALFRRMEIVLASHPDAGLLLGIDGEMQEGFWRGRLPNGEAPGRWLYYRWMDCHVGLCRSSGLMPQFAPKGWKGPASRSPCKEHGGDWFLSVAVSKAVAVRLPEYGN